MMSAGRACPPGVVDIEMNYRDRWKEIKRRDELASGAITRSELLALRFWPFVARGTAGECWLWMGSVKDTGYGQFTINSLQKAPLRAHRVAWEIANGPIPKGLHVLHHCDNRRCVNARHLFLGTNHDNIKDMWAKGRAVIPQMLRHRQPTA